VEVHACLICTGGSLWFPMDDPSQNYSFMSWNVRGMNNAASREDVKQMVALYKPDLICL
jgi:hypothetical protein